MDSIKIFFMGSPASVIPVLQQVMSMGIKVAGVFTNPDSQSGRGNKLKQTPVKEFAISVGLDVFTPLKLARDEERLIRDLGPDLIILAAYGKLIPASILEIPRLGCLNVHPSLLPRHRGASPVASAILAGDEKGGTSLIRMDEGLDTGPVIAQREISIRHGADTPELTKELFILGAELLSEVLPEYLTGSIVPSAQSDLGVTVTRRLNKNDGRIDWTKSALVLERELRAYADWPGSATVWKGRRLQIINATKSDEKVASRPGTILQVSMKPFAIGVVTGDGVLQLGNVRLEGRQTMDAVRFARGQQGFLGSILPNYE